MIDGILLINKEKDITSYDVIRKLKKILHKKQKIGHAGTLDPFATGLLVILLGRGTKLMERFHTLDKEYIVKAEFGYSTDTQDVTGEILEKSEGEFNISKEDIEEKIKSKFLGNIIQTPPMYSAKKVNGEKAYDIARKGETVELKEKEIHVKIFELLEYDYPRVTFRILCGTGTYIRTLVNDLGNELGCYATAVELCREKIGPFSLDMAISSQSIEEDILKAVITLDNIKI